MRRPVETVRRAVTKLKNVTGRPLSRGDRPHGKMLACSPVRIGGSWRSSSAIHDGPLNLKLGTRRSGVLVGAYHDPHGMFSRRQATDMPIVVIGRIFGDPGIDLADLFAIEENVGTSTFLAAAAHDSNARAFECECRRGTGRACFFELTLIAPREPK